MSLLDEIFHLLQGFGLTVHQVKVYMVLLQWGDLKISKIVSRSHIPRSTVYQILGTLSRIGLVEEIIDQKLSRYHAHSPSILRHILEEQQQKTELLLESLPALEFQVNKLLADVGKNEVTVRYFRGISGGRQFFWNTLSATTPVLVYSAFGRSKFVGKVFYRNFVRESQDRHIKEQVIINPSQRVFAMIGRDTGTPLARTNIRDIRVIPETVMHIEGETFLYDNVFAQIQLGTEGIFGFEIESSRFATMQRSIFASFWERAKKMSIGSFSGTISE